MITINVLKRRWAVALLLLMMVWVMPGVALADDGLFDSPTQAFTWYSKGPGIIHLKLMTTNASPYRTLHRATYGLRDENGNKTNVFYVGEKSSNSGYVTSQFKNMSENSLLFLTNDTQLRPYCLITGGQEQQHDATRNGKDDAYVEMDWYYPVAYAGKKFTFYVEAFLYNDGKEGAYNKDLGTMEFDEIMFSTYDPIFGMDDGDAGMIQMPVVSDHVINWIEAKYKKSDGEWVELPRVELGKEEYMSLLQLPACDRHDSLIVKANIVSATVDKSNLPVSNWPSVVSGDSTLFVGTVGMIHAPKFLTSSLLQGGGVKLEWDTDNADVTDLFEGDMFEIQRSLTGKLEDFQSIEQIALNKDTTYYSYTDDKLISALKPELIDAKLGMPLVRYRVVRSATKELWGTRKNPTLIYTQPSLSALKLLHPVDTKADWLNKDEQEVELTWDYDKAAHYNWVWDNRAEMRIDIRMENSKYQFVDSVSYVLTEDEIKAGRKVVKLHRSCVNYYPSIVVDPKQSPIGMGTGEIFFAINNDDDFSTFLNRVYNGESHLNAVLLTMIDAGNRTVAPEREMAYAGNFNGNGFKIFIDYSMHSETAGLFRNITEGAVITNLTVEGFINTGNKFAGGIVGHLFGGNAFIENCTSGVTIKSSVNGDGTHGGLVALANESSTLYVSNSYYLGSFVSTDPDKPTSHWGGLVGYRGGGSYAQLNNNFFNPMSLSAASDRYSATFVRCSAGDELQTVIHDCLYSSPIGKIQGLESLYGPVNRCWKNYRPLVKQCSFDNIKEDYSVPFHTKPKQYFYFESSGAVDVESLVATTLQNSVLLEWKTTEGAIDYFEVLRRNVTTGESWETIATQIVDREYEDRTVSPVFDYIYKVSSNNDCEGIHKTFTNEVPGNCVKTGKVEGYVRFADGTGIPDITVTASQKGSGASASGGGSCTTDENGFFSIEGLDYWGYQQGAYQLTLSGISADDLDQDCRDGIPVTFDARSNYEKNCIFTVTKGVKFSGLVLYHGTSIPVHGAHFLVDGKEVRTASGPVESDFEGKFSFRMIPRSHTIQAVMDGHDFYQNGYYYKNNSNDVEFSVDVANVYFYDDTRVKLIGRVVGGKDQGDLPLDNSLSTNNLGDKLKMVLTLEGDNASWLVFDNVNRSVTEKDTTYIHKKYGQLDTNVYSTRVHTNRHRIEVQPDSLTGEYQVWLPPVKWKIQQITADGYATLFQDGKTSDVIDLTDSLTLHKDIVKGKWRNRAHEDISQLEVEYNAIYNRIYRTPVLLERKQVGYDKFDYFGERYYIAQSLVGPSVKVPLVYQKTVKDKNDKEETKVFYTFGHPVFSTDRGYPFIISAVERYYYNNNVASDTVDVVKIDGGFVTIRNGLISGTQRDTLTLDENGEGYYVLRATQRPYLVKGEGALCTVTFSMERDGVTYEGEPLKAYTLSQYAKPGAKDYMSIEKPILVDILRDPPGGGSSAKLSKGSTLKLTYQMDMSWKGGLSMNVSSGSKLNYYSGVGGLGFETGIINLANNDWNVGFDLVFSGSGQRAFSYTMTANEDISTDGGSTMVGAEADLYMGVVTNLFLQPSTAIRAIPDSTFIHKTGELASGRMVEIAKGIGEDGGTYHLVRDEIVGFGQRVKSTFVHSQNYIIKQLIPGLAKQSKSLIYVGTPEEAQTLANSTGKRVYRSLRKMDDPKFGLFNTDSITGQYIYNSTIHPYEGDTKLNYVIVVPNTDSDESYKDEIYDLTNLMVGWAEIIQQNEKEKLEATELVKNFDVDGGASISYSEDFASDYTNSHTFTSPFAGMAHNYFDWDDPNKEKSVVDELKNLGPAITGIFGQFAGSILANFMKTSGGGTTISGAHEVDNTTGGDGVFTSVEFSFAGAHWKMSFTPVISYGVVPKQSINTKYNRKESFTIKMDKKSHLNFDLYRVKTIDTKNDKTVNGTRNDDRDIFIETNFLRNLEYVKYFIDRGVGAYEKGDFVYPRSFVYRTRGGATVRPWEDERKTQLYRSGRILDERTKKIENPIIKMDKQSISGVPFDEPARFKIYMTNESEVPEAIGGGLMFYNLYLDGMKNPKGAKLLVDGMPLGPGGMTVKVVPGEVTEKTLEVFAGEDYDYEDLTIGVMSQGDVQCFQEVSFSVHFLRTAGNVEIATPGDKWIMNTDASYDGKRGWYMPVIISGFNKNQKNFDHIELQYKESTRGDDYWTSLCSFYADSTLYKTATGMHEMIPENGNIVTRFYGEGIVIEKAYDLRARLYCRNGNSFITSDSKVLSGIKDTRRPQLFGSPDPKDGLIGPGDNIVFNFTEAIEHNYLQQSTNFEVVGETNETAFSDEPSLLFSGSGYAETDARRNFANKSVTIDMMVRPDDIGDDMPLFSHGIDGHSLQLWLTKEWYLRGVVDGVSFDSDLPLKKGTLQQVALIIDHQNKQALLYNDSIIGRKDNVTYSGYGSLIFGATNEVDGDARQHYRGRMLEARIWNRAMTAALLNTYGRRQLTGYEMGLADYYPMNDGESRFAVDKAQGANAELHGATWALPQGMSLSLDRNEQKDVKGMQLNKKFMERSEESDYTLMFWFKTNRDGQGALLSNGSGRKTDDNPRNKFFIGFEDGQLKYRSNGCEVVLGDKYADDAWHHFAMTVDRSHKLANIWLDRQLRSSLPADTLGGMEGDDFFVGNMVWHEAGASVQTMHSDHALTGHIDELCLFAQALPPSLLKRYSTKSPSGKEKGMLLYMGFNRQERLENNEIELLPFALNQRVKFDSDGKPTNKHDTVFVEPVSYVMQHIDHAYGAPVQANKELRNLNFSFVGRDNQLLVNIDEQDARINKRNLYVTVTDIPDVNGNYMASPYTAEFFVDRNPLRWERKTVEETVYYNNFYYFELKVINTSGAVHTYTIDNLPRWLTVDRQSDVIEPNSEQTIHFDVNKELNPGTYDELIYLTDENGLSEPLSIIIRKEGESPYWFVDPELMHFSMNVVGQVKMGDAIVTDPEDMVAAFDKQRRCLGLANVKYNPNTAESRLFMTVYDSTAVSNQEIYFVLWHHQTGQILVLETDREVSFSPGSVVGSVDDPVMMVAGSFYYQPLDLLPGWNWISFYLNSDDFFNPGEMLNRYEWSNGDIVTDDTEDFTFVYNEELGEWLSNKGKVEKLILTNKHSYRLYSHHYLTIEIPGYPLEDEEQRTIPVKNGWNNIGYTPTVNLPVSTALADYSGIASNRDVVKSRSAFAVYTEIDAGNGYWSGSLDYMKPGEGYMLYRNSKEQASFKYPYIEPGSTYFENTVSMLRVNRDYANTMSLAANAVGVELQEGDRLLAFSEGELRGEAEAIDSVFYVSIAGDKKAPLSFAIEREGEIIAATAEVMVFEKNAISGSPLQPTAISFVRADLSQQGWYTVDGVKLQSKPQRKGVYIYNGKKKVIK